MVAVAEPSKRRCGCKERPRKPIGDGGLYKPWSSILEHFKGDTDEALVFAEKRRKEDRGTSTCRNTGVETFLLYGEESINWTTKKLDS